MTVLILPSFNKARIRTKWDADRGVAQCATVLVMPSGVAHANWIGREGAKALLVTLDPTWRELARLPRRWKLWHRGAPARIFLRLCQTLSFPLTSERETIEELLLEVIDIVGATPEPLFRNAPRCVRSARGILRETAFERSLSALARETKVDVAYLSRAFRLAEGCTMGEYRRRLRVKKAATPHSACRALCSRRYLQML